MIRLTVLAICLLIYRVLANEIPDPAPGRSPQQRKFGSKITRRPRFFGSERRLLIENTDSSNPFSATRTQPALLNTRRLQDQRGEAASNIRLYGRNPGGGNLPRLSIIQHTNERQTFLSGHVHHVFDIPQDRTDRKLPGPIVKKVLGHIHRWSSSSNPNKKTPLEEIPDPNYDVLKDSVNNHGLRKRSLDFKSSHPDGDFLIDTDAKLTEPSESMHSRPLSLSQLSFISPKEMKTLTLPLYRPQKFQYDNDIHPEIQFQQHLNHALQRHAHFLNTSLDDADLVDKMRKRVESLSLSFNESILRRRDLPLSPKGNSSNGYPQSSFHALNNSTITSAATPTAKNSIGLSIEANDVGYFAEISVGTPPKKFKIILDSGSADTWLMLPQCRNLQDQALACNHPTLNPSSSTLRTTNTKFKVSYGTGSVQGFLVQEDITIGGLVLPHHTFGGVTLASNEFSGPTIPFDGLMGTAKTSLSSQKVITPIEAMAKAGIISGAFIGYSLGRVSDNQNIGQATFGGVDQTKFSGNLTMFPNVSKKGFWEGEMATILVDGQVVLTQRTGILDTGTTLIVAPPADAQALHDRIPGASSDGKGGFFIPCTSKAKVALSFGGVVFEINPGDLTFQPTTTNLSGKCISGISSGTIGGPRQWLLGDTFLKNVYFATDATHDEIGMAVLKKVSSKG